ncbi:MAG: NrfD/PsrC family molybdoenzyme membrane anchor subunit [Acidimicrobiales bacterium]
MTGTMDRVRSAVGAGRSWGRTVTDGSSSGNGHRSGDGAPAQTRRRRRGGGEQPMVPDAEFTSYYGRPVVRPSPWTADIPAYLFLGGLAGGSSLLAAGADLTGLAGLRRATRATALAALGGGTYALVHDLGRPSRMHHMLRVAKPTSPMSVGSWLLAAYGPLAGAAAASELAPAVLGEGRAAAVLRLGRAAGLGAAGFAPAVASYTGVLLGDTATPTWAEAGPYLPWLFVSGAAAAAGGAALVTAPRGQSAPARRLGLAGAVGELVATEVVKRRAGLAGEPMGQGRAGRYARGARWCTVAGAGLGLSVGGRSRLGAAAAGALLAAGSWCSRFAVFHGGQQSAADPRYTVVPQRERLRPGT